MKEMSLSLELKAEGSIDAESEGGDCHEVMRAGLGEPGGEWTGFGGSVDRTTQTEQIIFIGRARSTYRTYYTF